MRRIEKILLSKVPIWIVVVMLTLAAAGTVVFGTIVKDATTRDVLNLDNGHFLGRVAIEIAGIPENLNRLLFEPHPAEAQEQRFDGQAGLDLADTAHFPGDGEEEGYLLLVRYLPKPASGQSIRKITALVELIDLGRRKTVHVWNLNPVPGANHFVYVLPGGSLIVGAQGESVARLGACSNVEWRRRWKTHHSMERDADGNFWAPAASDGPHRFEGDELLKFSPSGEVLSRISLAGALVRGGYRHLLYGMSRYKPDPLHINDVQPVLRDGPFRRRSDLFVSLRTHSVVFLYRPATDEVVWLRQGPWLHQHDVDVVSESEISVFSNNAFRTRKRERRVLGANEVYVYDFATGEARSPWREAMRRHEVRTATMGGAILLGDGGLMVEEHNFGRVLRLSADGALRWSYVNRASDGQVYRVGWSRYLDAEYGAEVARSIAVADCTSAGPKAGAAH